MSDWPRVNAKTLLGGTWAAPGAIGSTTPNTGAFTALAVGAGYLTITGTATSFQQELSVINTHASGIPFVLVGDSGARALTMGHKNASAAASYGWLSYAGLDPTAGAGIAVRASGSAVVVGIGTVTPVTQLDVRGGLNVELTNPTRTIDYFTYRGEPPDANPLNVAVGVSIKQTWSAASVNADGAALTVQASLDAAATTPVSPGAIFGGFRNYKSGADVYGIGGFINNDVSVGTPSGTAFWGIVRNKAGGAVGAFRATSESVATNPGYGLAVGNSAADNAFLSGVWIQSWAVNGVLVGGASGAAVVVGARPFVFQDTLSVEKWYVDASGNTSAQVSIAVTGFRQGTMTAARVLRSDGTNFISAQLAAADLSNGVSGSGAVVLVTGATLITPTLGEASATTLTTTSGAILQFGGAAASGVFASGTDLAIRALGTGIIYIQTASGATTRGNWSSTGLRVGDASAAAATLDVGGGSILTNTINKITITAPASGATLAIADGKVFTAANTLTLAGTDGAVIAFQGTDTYVGRATTDTLTNKTITGGTHTAITSLGVRDTTGAFDVTIAATSTSASLSAGRVLTLDVGNVAHTVAFGTTANTITFPNAASGTVPLLNLAQIFTAVQAINLNAAALPTALSGVVLRLGGVDGASNIVEMVSAAGAVIFAGRRSGNTMASPSATVTGTVLVALQGYGHDGSNWTTTQNAQIAVTAAETWSTTGSGAHGTNIVMQTTPIGSPTAATVLTLTSTAHLQIGKALVALGGGAAPTFGTIGGSGPATAAQNTWLELKDSAGNTCWVPVWK